MKFSAKSDRTASAKNIRIIYEDNHIIVAVKPFNMLSQRDATGDDDILSALKTYIKEKYIKPGDVYLGLVHRLDRPAGGLMVFARTSKAAQRLASQMRQGRIGKTYILRAHGRLPQDNGELVDLLVKTDGNIVKTALPGTPGAKEARLTYCLIPNEFPFADKCSNADNGDFASDLQRSNSRRDEIFTYEVNLITGRSHQIRVQFASRGCPLVGDTKYGPSIRQTIPGKMRASATNLALWSFRLSFIHPTKKDEMMFECPPPDGFFD